MTEESYTDKLLARGKRLLEVGSEAADVLVHLQHGASPIGLAAVGLRVINSVREHRAQSPEEYFVEWKPFDLGMLATQALVALRAEVGVECREVNGLHEDTPALITVAEGVEIGWGVNGNLKTSRLSVHNVWARKEADIEMILKRLGQSMWKHVGNFKICLEVQEDSVKLVAEDDSKILSSAKGDEMYERIKKFQAKGLNRSFFIIGDPGVGKSCLLRYVSSLYGGLRLRLHMRKLVNFDPHKLIRIVELLRPSILVVDDFDRYVMGDGDWEEQKESPEGQAMLDPLDAFDKLVPLVLVSANYSKAITPALLRPGRFAEMVTIDEIDPEIYEKLLPDAPASLIKKLKKLDVPVAYLEEIRLRAEALGYEVAEEELPDLLERADIIFKKNEKTLKKPTPSVVYARRRKRMTGKTAAQKAAILDRRGATLDMKAVQVSRKAAALREQAEKARDRAQDERDKVARAKARGKKKVVAKSKA